MSDYRQYNDSVDIRLVIRSIYKHRKIVLIIAIALAVIFPVFKYKTDPPVAENIEGSAGSDPVAPAETANSVPDTPEIRNLRAELNTLSNNKAKLENYLAEIEEQYTQLKEEKSRLDEHKKSSMLMKIDPYNVNRALRVYRITNKEGAEPLKDDVLNRIVASYAASAAAANADANETLIAEPNILVFEAKADGNTITLRATAPDKATADKYIKNGADAIEKSKAGIESGYGSHEITMIDDKSYTETDENLKKVQEAYDDAKITALNGVEDKIQSLNASLYTISTQMRGTEDALGKAMNPPAVEDTSEEENLEEDKGTTPADMVIWAILGFVLGMLFPSLYYGFVYIMADTIRCDDEIIDRYGVRVIGSYADKETSPAVSAVIETLLGADKEVLLLSTLGAGECDKVAEVLRENIKDINILSGGDIRRDAEGVKLLNKKGKIILLEQKDKSSVNGIRYEVDIVRTSGSDIIGCLVS